MDAWESKQYERFKNEAQLYRALCRDLKAELHVFQPELYQAQQKIDRLEQSNAKYKAENLMLKRKLKDLTLQLQQQPRAAPAFVKANVAAEKAAKKPGRRKGHAPAVRPRPVKIDVHQTVSAPVDALGKPSCPHCCVQLSDVKHHERLVEELIPSEVRVTCYHTTSGYCGKCRKVVESRAPQQPPAADLPHAQLGLNALASAAVMRVCYRLPLRQITRLFKDLPGLSISPGAIVKQIKRLGQWLEKQYHRLKLALRLAGVVHADETGWRTNGKNGYLWTLTNADHNDADADRLTKRIRKHRDSLTTFLHKKEVDGTNNAAERAIRPAVIMRKITGGSRSKEGAKAWSILASVMRTAEQQGRPVLETVKTLLQAEWAGKEITLLTDLVSKKSCRDGKQLRWRS